VKNISGKILVTGFEPFGGETINPALEAVCKLQGKRIANREIVAKSLPVVKNSSIEILIEHIKTIAPEVIIAVGQAGARNDISIERVAINMDDFRIPDNAGNQPVDEPIVPGGPTAYWSTLPSKAIVENLREGKIPASISNTAGTYVCNHLFYGLMHFLAEEGNIRRGGFVHIPYLPEQAARITAVPSMSLDTVVRGLELAIEAAAVHVQDKKIAGGSIC
jgi:pyroglutamyl-peptidase